MKRGALIFLLGLVVAVAAYACVYMACTASARDLLRKERPELAWLKEEFDLRDAEFARISEFHAAYLPRCRELCRRIDAQNAYLQKLLAKATNATPEIDAALLESAQTRAECQKMMLRHFFQVSQTMPAAQGRRYLAWVNRKAFAPNFEMAGDSSAAAKPDRSDSSPVPAVHSEHRQHGDGSREHQ